MEMGKYIYGVVISNNGNTAEMPARGDISFVRYKDMSAMVRECEIIDFHALPTVSLARVLVEHQKSIEQVMSDGHTIIPMRLGTFAADEPAVLDILGKGYSLIKEIVQKTDGKIELDVVATWSDLTAVIQEAREDKEVKEFKEKLLSSPKGITVDDQIKVGVMLKKALDGKREKYSAEISNALASVSCAAKPHALMDDKMVINSAFLINVAMQKEFDCAVERLNAEFEEKLNFRCVGPLPPYSFYTLEVANIAPADLDWARGKLDLSGPAATKEEIKRAYRRAAFFFHPDAQPGKPGTEKEFDDLRRAYKLLLDYCQAVKQADDEEKIVFSAEKAKKETLLVKVKE